MDLPRAWSIWLMRDRSFLTGFSPPINSCAALCFQGERAVTSLTSFSGNKYFSPEYCAFTEAWFLRLWTRRYISQSFIREAEQAGYVYNMCVCIHVHAYVCMCRHTCAHIRIYIFIHTCTHLFIFIRNWLRWVWGLTKPLNSVVHHGISSSGKPRFYI